MEKGTIVEFTAGSLGTLLHPDASRFEAHSVSKGDHGDYVGPHPNPALADEGWHLCSVSVWGATLYVPVHLSHFREAQGRSLAQFAAGH